MATEDIEVESPAPGTLPEWRRRIADMPPTADWWRRRHHCSDAVLGQSVQVETEAEDSVDA